MKNRSPFPVEGGQVRAKEPETVSPVVHCDGNLTVGIMGYVEGKNWILEKMADLLIKNRPDDINIILTKEPLKGPDVITLYWPYRCFKKIISKSISFHTHPEKPTAWAQAAAYSDHIITMCDKYTDLLIKQNTPEEKITKIMPGVDEEFTFNFTLFFPCGMKKHGMRKGEKLWKRVSQIPNVRTVCSDGEMTHQQIVTGTKRADAVFISSMEEGGPMCLIEALACGTPIIAPRDVGWCEEFGNNVILYDKGDLASARTAINKLLLPKLQRVEAVKHLTWKNWCDQHYQLFRKVHKGDFR